MNESEFYRRVNATTLMVNLDSPARMPVDGMEIDFSSGEGCVMIKIRQGELYIDNRKVILFSPAWPKIIEGNELRKILAEKSVLHPNIMDALYENQELIPDSWKERGRKICFWGAVFRLFKSHFYVRCLYFDSHANTWRRAYRELCYELNSSYPAAVLDAA